MCWYAPILDTPANNCLQAKMECQPFVLKQIESGHAVLTCGATTLLTPYAHWNK